MPAIETMAHAKGRKSTQRERLLASMIEVAARRGYAGANVSAVIGQAGVSRPTFYDYFADREACFAAAIQEVAIQLQGTVEQALAERPAVEAAAAAVEEILAYVAAEPVRARILLAEAPAGGARALDTRDRALEALGAAVEERQSHAAAEASLPDLPPAVLLGAVQRLLAARLRRGEAAAPEGLRSELLDWLAAYLSHASRWRGRRLAPGRAPARSPHLPDAPLLQAPAVLPPGRPRIPEAQIAENHRLRIVHAVAQLAGEKGYAAMTVADITRLASIDGRAFYRLFADKQQAFLAAYELGFQRTIDVVSRAYFSERDWPARSREALRALLQTLQANPLLARLWLIEAHAAGAPVVQRIEDGQAAFVFFLQEGLAQQPSAMLPVSRTAMEAVVAGVFELVYARLRAPGPLRLGGMLGLAAHLWLVPFLGDEERARSGLPRQSRPGARGARDAAGKR